jgi:Sec-independent protein translocase protein TatA
MAGLMGWQWVILLVGGAALFGARQLPDAVRGRARSTRIPRAELSGSAEPDRVAGTPGDGLAAANAAAASTRPTRPATVAASVGPEPGETARPGPVDRPSSRYSWWDPSGCRPRQRGT